MEDTDAGVWSLVGRSAVIPDRIAGHVGWIAGLPPANVYRILMPAPPPAEIGWFNGLDRVTILRGDRAPGGPISRWAGELRAGIYGGSKASRLGRDSLAVLVRRVIGVPVWPGWVGPRVNPGAALAGAFVRRAGVWMAHPRNRACERDQRWRTAR